jgi:hypothetical protein
VREGRRNSEKRKIWIAQAVSKGADYEEYAKVFSPLSIVTSDSNKLALKLL